MEPATIDKKVGNERAVPGGGIGFAAGFLVAVASFILYVRTLAPTVLYYAYPDMRDSVALQVRAYLLGIPDVTGYPTYTMLTHLFTYLPFGDPAYRVNLASAVYAAAAVYLVYLVCLRLTRRIAPSAAGALLFALSQTFWSQAVIAEVYTLNALFVAAILLALLVWRDERRDRYLLLAAFLTGLSLTHHLTSGLLLPAGLLFVLSVERSKLTDLGLILKGTSLFLLGLLPYLYLPIRASMEFTKWTVSIDPTVVRYDPSTFDGFVDLITGGDFKGLMFAFGPAELPARGAYYFGYLVEQFHPGFLALTLLGAAYLLVKDRAALALLGFLYLGWLFYVLEYDISDIYYQFIPTYLIIAAFTAVGLATLLGVVETLVGKYSRRTRIVVAAVVSAVIILAPFLGVGETYAEVDRSEDYKGSRMLEAVATKAGPDATVIHHRSPLWYMYLVEERRRDVELVASFEITLKDHELEAAKAALRAGRPAYILDPGADDARYMYKASLDLVPVEEGTLYEVVPRDDGRRGLG